MPTTKSDAFYQLAKDGGLWLCELVAKSFTKSPKAALVSQALSEALYNLQMLPKIIMVESKDPNKISYAVVHSFLQKNQNINLSEEKFEEKYAFSIEELKNIAKGKIPLSYPRLLNESKEIGNYVKKLETAGAAEKLTERSIKKIQSSGQTPIFCGHTPLKSPCVYLNHIHLDTGAGKANKAGIQRKLSAINTQTGEIHQVNADFPEIKIEPRDYAKRLEKALEKGEKIPDINR
jgi:hypothetical protein